MRTLTAAALSVISAVSLLVSPVSAKGAAITLKPTSGDVGDEVRINGEDFGAGSKVVICWDGEDVANGLSVDGRPAALSQFSGSGC